MTIRTIWNNRNFVSGFLLTLATGLYLVIDSCLVGKNEFFLLMNKDLGTAADFFFRYWTYLGDGAFWVAIALLFFRFHKRKFPLLIAAILFSTLIAQLTKNYLFPAEPRPTAAITGGHSIHTVPGVELHTAYSFPSGHTATAFTIYLLGCLLIRTKWFIIPGFLYALLVGYSRIYLAQHFPIDVGGGMFTALITILLSVFFQQQWDKKNQP